MNHAKAGVLKNQTGKKKEYRILQRRRSKNRTRPENKMAGPLPLIKQMTKDACLSINKQVLEKNRNFSQLFYVREYHCMNAVAKNARVQMLWCKCDVANAMAKMLWVAKIPCHKCRGTNARMLWPESRSLNELAQMLWWECIGINVVARMRWWECCGAKAVNIRCECCTIHAVTQMPWQKCCGTNTRV